jgi:hypothetical protein
MLFSYTFGYANFLDVKWVGVIMLKIRVCIFVKSIGPLTETMPNHGRSFTLDFLISLNKFNLVHSWVL